MKINPRIKRTTFKIMVMAETFNGKKFSSTMARPEILPTVTVLGIMKKKTAAATIRVAKVMIRKSFMTSPVFIQ